jgi:hypothetical protein
MKLGSVHTFQKLFSLRNLDNICSGIMSLQLIIMSSSSLLTVQCICVIIQKFRTSNVFLLKNLATLTLNHVAKLN